MTALPASVAGFDLKKLSTAFLDDPYPTYRALREFDPNSSDAGWIVFPDALR